MIFTLTTKNVAAEATVAYTVTGTGNAANLTTSGLFTVDSSGKAVSQAIVVPSNVTYGDSGTLVLALANGKATSPTISVTDTSQNQNFNLTQGVDTVSGNVISADITPYIFSGKGPTLTSGDTVTGTGTKPVLNIFDGYAQGNDIIAVGTNIIGFDTINLQTQGNAGNGLSNIGSNAGVGAAFDSTSIVGLNNLNVYANGPNTDNINASQTTNIVATHSNATGGMVVNGGADVTVVSNGAGSTTIGGNALGQVTGVSSVPAGNVTVTGTYGNALTNTINGALSGAATDVGGSITVYGGKNVTVNQQSVYNAGAITVGNVNDGTKTSYDPSGAIAVSSAGFGSVTAYLSSTTPTVSVTSAAGYEATGSIIVGDSTGTVANTIATITVIDKAAAAFDNVAPTTTAKLHNNKAASVAIYGGKDVSVTTNAGSVVVGNGLQAINNTNSTTQTTDPTGNISVTNTATDNASTGTSTVSVDISGGGSGAITVSANNDIVRVGKSSAGAQNSVNAVTVTETNDIHGSNIYGSSAAAPSVTTDGGSTTTITARGQNVSVGATSSSSNAAPTGAVVVSENAVLTGRGLGNGQGAVVANGQSSVTVASTGGNVTVGARLVPGTQSASALPQGAVSITDTYGGQHTDAFTVVGGTTVSISSTKTSGNVTVGDTTTNNTSITLNVAGTGLLRPETAATGDVTYSSLDAKGVYSTTGASVQTKYGTGTALVYTNGATTVSLTGVGGSTIDDIQSVAQTAGANAGLAVGVSKLATVNLTGYSGASNIYSDVLSALNLTDGASNVTVTDNSTAHAGTITLNQVKGGTITDNAISALTVTTAGTVSNTVTLADSSWTSIAFTNAAPVSVTLSGGTSKLASIVATNTGTLALGDLTGYTKLATVNASGATGAVSASINPSNTAFTGGTGNETVTINQYSNVNSTTGLSVATSGGAGTDKLIANYVAAASQTPSSLYLGFETLYLGTAASSSTAAYDATGFTTIGTGGAVAAGVTFSNVAAGVPLNVEVAPGYAIKVNLASSTGSSDALTVNLGTSATAADTDFSTINLSDAATGAGIEIVTINSQGTGSKTNTVALSDTNNKTKTLKFAGAEPLAVTSASTAVATLDASAATGSVNAKTVVLKDASVTVIGGAGALTVDLTNVGASATRTTQTYADSVTSGTGGVTLTLGTGGQWSSTASAGAQNGATYVGAPANGAETVNLTASVAAKDVINVPVSTVSVSNNTTGGVTGFTSLNSTASDQLVLMGTGTGRIQTADIYALKNVGTATNVGTLDVLNLAYGLDPSGALSAKLVNLLYTASNGVISFSTVAGHNLTEFTAADLMHAGELIVDYSTEAPISVTGNGTSAGVSTTSGSNSVTVSSATNLAVGQVFAAAGIPDGTTITAITGTTLTLSAGATATGTLVSFKAAYGSVLNANSNRVAAIVPVGSNTYVVAAPEGSVTYSPLGITQTATDPTFTVTHAGAAGSLVTVINGVNVTTLLTGATTIANVAAAIAADITTAGIVGVTASASGAVITLTGGATVSLGAAGLTTVTASTANKTVTTNDTNAIVQLNGVTGLTGFGGLQTATTLYTGPVTGTATHLVVNNVVAPALTQGGSAAARTISATGYSSLDSTSLGTIGTTSTAVTGLAPSAKIDFGSNTDLKSFSVTQSGAAGSNALDVILGASQTAGTLRLNGDWKATLTGGSGGSVLDALVDSGATMTTLSILDGGAVTVNTVSDTALATIDASALTASLNLGAVTPLSNANLVVKLGGVGGSATNTVVTSGDGISISQGSGANTGAVTITAYGSSNTITLTSTTGNNQARDVQITGANDTINVTGGGTSTTAIGSVVDLTTHVATVPTAAVTLNLLGSASGVVKAWVGGGSTVNVGTSTAAYGGTATIKVVGDSYGTSGSGVVTVNNLPVTGLTHLKLDFGSTAAFAAGSTLAASQVNVSSATDLTSALKLAASYAAVANGDKIPANTGLIDWFQFNGNTYIVEAVNTASSAQAHSALATNDVVVQLTGLVNLATATITSGVVSI